ncbi:MAG: tryptophan synthase subunit alpha [Betaproteobacteria bacterium]|nr:tryptophan synthase subunit alpha [Betaproteobacteria bacterium]
MPANARIRDCFVALKAAKRCALIPYITAGDPSPAITLELMSALVEVGADVIELGVPFSDPMADGPAIQRAGERALAQKVGLRDVIGIVKAFRQRDPKTPVVLMGYANPVEAMGADAFIKAAAAAGVDGSIVVDYPPEECEEFAALAKASGIDPIFLVSPTSTEQRMRDVARVGSGYLYYVSLRGVTGAVNIDTAEVATRIARIRSFTDLPIGVGFGIRDPESARRIAGTADAVVIGSRIIEEIEAAGPAHAVERVKALVGSIRKAMDVR